MPVVKNALILLSTIYLLYEITNQCEIRYLPLGVDLQLILAVESSACHENVEFTLLLHMMYDLRSNGSFYSMKSTGERFFIFALNASQHFLLFIEYEMLSHIFP